jgi:hypothetical protein
MFLGLLPGGVTQDELIEIFENDDWMDDRDELIRSCMIV